MDPETQHVVDVLRFAITVMVLLAAIYLYHEMNAEPVKHDGWNERPDCATCGRTTKDGHRHG